jgi:hypothetical protein
LGPDVLRWVLGGSFIAMALWMLIPDSVDDAETSSTPRFGVFGTTVVAFFLAEMGDKTQIATVMLAAQYQAWAWVVAGTTLGMMLANAPVVWLGDKITKLVPLRVVHVVSALIFFGLGLLALGLNRALGLTTGVWITPGTKPATAGCELGFILAPSADLIPKIAGAEALELRNTAKDGQRNPFQVTRLRI